MVFVVYTMKEDFGIFVVYTMEGNFRSSWVPLWKGILKVRGVNQGG